MTYRASYGTCMRYPGPVNESAPTDSLTGKRSGILGLNS